jgi:hypothetical protein
MGASSTPQTEAARLYAEREKRFQDVIALRVPDRVPVVYWAMFWHIIHAGHSIREGMYNYELNAATAKQAVLELQPDGVMTSFMVTALGPCLDLLGMRTVKWPGHGVADNCSYQYIDMEIMKPEEYDVFLDDPTYFYLSRYFPRIAESLAPLAKFPRFPGVQHFWVLPPMRVFAEPDFVDAFKRLAEIGAESQKLMAHAAALGKDFAALGFPGIRGALSMAPFDYFADYFRGSKGIMLDMYRRKDKLLEAMDRVTAMLVRTAVSATPPGASKIIFIPLHWGLDGFMSLEQFKTFYWPQLRKLMIGLIENDLVPCVLWEGHCESRLETIADIPPGKAVYWFERTDMFLAKEVLGDIVCLRGNVSPSLLNTGTPDEVSAYCRKLIQRAGKNGGFILDGALGIPDEARPENVRAMFRTVHEYGRYQ